MVGGIILREKSLILKQNIGIILILLLSAMLNFANLGIENYANTYYSAGVKSMLMNLKNFFFVSSDPSGFVTIDKPPVGFWIQTIFAKIFGFSGLSVILPQAAAGVLSVWIMYRIVKKYFGNIAGLFSALILSITPIFVAASRNNTIDNMLVLFLMLAAWAILKATEEKTFKYFMISLVFVGIGFNVKMVEAYMIVPAIYIAYLLYNRFNLKTRIKHLIAGALVLIIISLSWAIIVDLVPKSQRPFVGSSTDNSVMQLIIGHNGLERVGIKTSEAKGAVNQQKQPDKSKNRNNVYKLSFDEKGNFDRNRNDFSMVRGPVSNNNSTPGINRLFYYNNLSDQIGWLLTFSIIGFIVAALQEKLKRPFDSSRKISLVFWGIWLATEFIYFSFSRSITHTYYMTTMAPAISALSGIGFAAMLKFYREESWKKFILPVSLLINGLVEINILSTKYNTSMPYKITFILTVILCLAAAVFIIINLAIGNKYKKINKTFIITPLIGMLLPSLIWSATTVFYPMNGSSPSAGLELVSNKQNRNTFSNEKIDSKLIGFLEENRNGSKYLAAVPSAMTYASDLILKTGEPVMTIGGYSGNDKIITLDKFKQVVSSGQLRYALISGASASSGGMRSGGGGNSQIINWIEQNGKIVSDGELNSKNSNSKERNSSNIANSIRIYDLSNIE